MNLFLASMILKTSPLSRDSVKFSKIIHKALPVVAMLLGSKQSTDILEAIDFFVSAFEFGVQNSMLGVRRMLSLIWSGEATIREAVVAAYKRLYIEVRIRFGIDNRFVWLPISSLVLMYHAQGREQRGGERSAAAATARNFLALVYSKIISFCLSIFLVSYISALEVITNRISGFWGYFGRAHVHGEACLGTCCQ